MHVRYVLTALFTLTITIGCTACSINNTSTQNNSNQSEYAILHSGANPVELNDKYEANDNHGAEPADSVLWVNNTHQSNVVVVAPHSVWHYRAGEPKKPDLMTGGMAEALADSLGASVLTVAGEVSDWGDNWSTRDDEFTRILNSLPSDSLVIDIHGMSDSCGVDVAVGTAGQTSDRVRQLSSELLNNTHGYNVDVDGIFTGSASYTDTSYLSSRGIDCVQVELSRSLRRGGSAQATVDWLSDAINSVE